MNNTTTCKACGRKIFYALNPETKKSIPLDARRVASYDLIEMEAGQEAVKREPGYISHFLTCPNADQFSKGVPR